MHHKFKILHSKPRHVRPKRLPRDLPLRLPRRIPRRHDLRISLHLDAKSSSSPVVAEPIARRVLHAHHVDVPPVEARRARVPRPGVVGFSLGRAAGQDRAGPLAARLLGHGGVLGVGGVQVQVVVDGVQSDEFPGGVGGRIVRGEMEGEDGLGRLAVVAREGA